jgi:hypothetical protein
MQEHYWILYVSVHIWTSLLWLRRVTLRSAGNEAFVLVLRA